MIYSFKAALKDYWRKELEHFHAENHIAAFDTLKRSFDLSAVKHCPPIMDMVKPSDGWFISIPGGPIVGYLTVEKK